MNSLAMLGRIVEVLDHVDQFWESHPVPSTPRGARSLAKELAVVTIDREVGTPDQEISREVGARLGWPVYDHELLEIIALREHWPLYAIEELDERHVSWLQESFESFWSFPGVREVEFVHRLVETIAELGTKGHCVIVGRGAEYILPRDGVLHVRLIAAREDRIATLARRQEISLSAAARRLATLERSRREFVRSHFPGAAMEPSDALVLNTSHITLSECADLIVDALQRRSAAVEDHRFAPIAQRQGFQLLA
jgi:cytidylate kinase